MTFVIFFTIFSILYLLMQAYMIRKVWKAFPGMGPWRWGIVAWAVLMVATIWVYGAFRSASWAQLLGPLVMVAFCWLVVVFWFLIGGLLIDVWNVLWRLVAGLSGRRQFTHVIVPARAVVILLAMLSALGVVWGVFRARAVDTVTQTFSVPSLPEGRTRLRIVQISDLHLTGYSRRAQIRELLDRVQWLKGDVIVSTGDLMDAPAEELADFAAMFRNLQAPLGKYAIFGNHEYYVGEKQALKFHADAGLALLRQESVPLVAGVTLAGLDDWHPWQHIARNAEAAESQTLAAAKDAYVILLKHQPLLGDDSAGRFNLQLSGHTHGGQVFPFQFFVRLRYSRIAGLYDVGKGSQIYVSRGTGTWGPAMRIGAPPEITVIDLVTDR